MSRWRAQTTSTATHVCHGDAGFVALTQVLDQEAVFLPMWPAGLHSHITKPRAMPHPHAVSYLAMQVNVVAQAHVSGRDDSGGTISNHSDGAYHTSVQCSVHTLLRGHTTHPAEGSRAAHSRLSLARDTLSTTWRFGSRRMVVRSVGSMTSCLDSDAMVEKP